MATFIFAIFGLTPFPSSPDSLILVPQTISMTPDKLLQPSASFKQEAIKSIIAIVVFMLVYLLLMAAAVALVIAAFYAGIAIISLKPGLYTILAGVGIMGVGVMVFVFLVKFLFSSTKEDNSDSVEITEEDHPKLFATIYEIAEQTGTKRPKKVFLSPDVNACVFYNSSFWSMFLPVRKNLKIGLGLVNAVNASELKAVIAHEFGHFSQRSMKLGSWVYQVNKIIHDMLFNNRGYEDSLNAMGNIHGILAIFAYITVGIVGAIQWILRQVFKLVNKSYLSLSRQMEFHADLVAASTYGSNNVVNALHRIDYAAACYSTTLHLCNTALKQKKTVTDFYANHGKVQAHVAHLNGFTVDHGLVQPKQNNNVSNRVNYKDQWASHPTHEEREAYLQPFGLEAPVDHQSAWAFFTDARTWKQRFTEMIYAGVAPDEKAEQMEEKGFDQLLNDQMKRFSFPELFGEYYDGREVTVFNAEAVAATPYTMQPLDAWFGEEQKLSPKKLQFLEQDIAVLDAIAKKTIETSSFDFDGKKYRRSEAAGIMATLEGEKESLKKNIEALDQRLFRHAYALAPLKEAEELKQDYLAYFKLRKQGEEFLSAVNNMMQVLAPVFQGQTLQVTDIALMVNDLKANHEPGFKAALQEWEGRGVFDDVPVLKGKIANYRSANWVYFYNDSFIETELIDLNTIVQESWECVSGHIFSVFRNLAEKEAAYLEMQTKAMVV